MQEQQGKSYDRKTGRAFKVGLGLIGSTKLAEPGNRCAEILTQGMRSRYRRKTGQSATLQAWRAETNVKRTMQRLKLRAIIDAGNVQPKVGAALELVESRYRTIWDLSQADRRDLLALPGVGEATVKRLGAYLNAKNVPQKFSV